LQFLLFPSASTPSGDQGSPVNSREKRPNPRIATLHCAIV